MTQPARNRRTIRLPNYDYARPGGYFVTIVTQDRIDRFGEIQNGNMIINEIGRSIETCWLDLPKRFAGIELDEYIIMPNHFHGILFITDEIVGAAPVAARPAVDAAGAGTSPAPTGYSLGAIIGAFKSITTHNYIAGVHQYGWPTFNRHFWQRNYYEHVIRSETELQTIRQYIPNNPAQWVWDEETLVPNHP